MSGAISITGFEETPLAARIPYVDFVTATNSAMAVVAALYYLEKTGKGQKIEVSLLRSACTLSSLVVSEYVTTKRERQPRRIGNRGYWSAYSNVCKTRDGKWVMIAVPAPMIRRLFHAMGKEELANSLRLASDIDIFDNRDITDPLIEDWIASKTMDELEEIALRFRIPLGPVLDYTEVLDHPQVQAEKLFTEATLSDGSFKMPVPAFPIRFSELAFKDNVVIPKLGEYNQEIWGKLCDLNAQELAKLKEEGII
jgi:crotonobetainyl-CoA:carnitine CoA-transferase CaiB-like acyl-CoA transferase